jgi:hypothetical protein
VSKATNFVLITAADQVILVGSYDAGLAEAKKHGKCRLYKLDLVDVLNANKADKPKQEPIESVEPTPAAPKKKKAK